MIIRRAVPADLSEIGRIVVQSWRATFKGLLPGSYLEEMSREHQEARHRRMFAIDDVIYHVAVSDASRPIGFASGGPTRRSDFKPENELYAIFLLPESQRKGIGSLLFHNVLADLATSGRNGLVAMVLTCNPNQGFYMAHGGRKTEAGPLQLGDHEIEQVAYLWDRLPAHPEQ